MNIADAIIRGYRVESAEELLSIVESMHRAELYEACHQITRAFRGDQFDTCSIINVKSGRCPEDCHWCTQSAHYRTASESYDILPEEEVIGLAKANDVLGVKRYSLVASGRKPSREQVHRYVELYKQLQWEVGMKLCASLGLADEEALQRLFDAGCTTYHCNMESAPSHFPKLCSTHTQEEKRATLEAARRVGMRRCSGGIIGMGETRAQRAEFAVYLASMGIESIPINILHPMPGTPLEHQEHLSTEEVLMAICMFRLANPNAFLRFSGGRALLSTDVQRRALYVGINAAITGGLLTTTASVIERDRELFKASGYDIGTPTEWNR